MLAQLVCREPGEGDTLVRRAGSQSHNREVPLAGPGLESVTQDRVLFSPALEGTLELRKEISPISPEGHSPGALAGDG